MFRTELLKIRSLPTPRNSILFVFGAILVACAIVGLVAPEGDSADWYYRAPEFAASLVGSISAMVLGAWVIGVEFASKTVRLAATVQPARLRLVATKFAVALGLVAAFAVLASGASYGAQAGMASLGGVDFPSSDALDGALAFAVPVVFWGAFAFGLVLLLRSYTAGLIVPIVLAIGIDNALQLIPKVGKYSFGSATTSLANTITGDSAANLTVGIAVITALAWVTAVNLAGAIRFAASDLK